MPRRDSQHTFLLVLSFLLAQPALAWVSRPPPLRAIFSDIDGTLVHYASDFERFGVKLVESDEAKLTAVVEGPNGDRRKCRLLPSLTMGPACVSLRTIELVDALRSHGVLFCVVTAARKSTMLARQPLLPVCDVHVCESGSRIVVGEQLDTAFAERFEQITGPLDRELDVSERPEALWAFFRLLQSSVPGLKCDARSYYGCFRVNTKGDAAIDARLHEVIVSSLPSGISWSMNLGKYDFYPAVAGKGNAVAHLQTRFGVERAGSACLFDDDNDLDMAEKCAIHHLPSLTSASVAAAAAQHPEWQVARTAGMGVFAVEECLEALLERAMAEDAALNERIEAALPLRVNEQTAAREARDP